MFSDYETDVLRNSVVTNERQTQRDVDDEYETERRPRVRRASSLQFLVTTNIHAHSLRVQLATCYSWSILLVLVNATARQSAASLLTRTRTALHCRRLPLMPTLKNEFEQRRGVLAVAGTHPGGPGARCPCGGARSSRAIEFVPRAPDVRAATTRSRPRWASPHA